MTGRKTPSYLLTLIICMSRDSPGGREESAADAVQCSDGVERACPQNITNDQSVPVPQEAFDTHTHTHTSCSRTQYSIYTDAFCFSCRALMPVSGRVNFRRFANHWTISSRPSHVAAFGSGRAVDIRNALYRGSHSFRIACDKRAVSLLESGNYTI